MQRILLLIATVAVVAVGLSCSSSLDDDEAVVYLSVSDIQYGPGAFTSVCQGVDVIIDTLTIQSNLKGGATASSAQDVILTRWVVTPYRTDGGTVASPVWTRDLDITVPAGGNTSLTSFNYYPAEFYNDPPLLYLFPENGGFDPETGERTIEETLRVEWFGHTLSGQSVNLTTNLYVKFACQW
jgi:hypothetical protein